MKTRVIIQIVLMVVIVVLSIMVYNSIKKPIDFNDQKAIREELTIQRLKDIREAEIAYKSMKGSYTGSFDTLINFLLNESVKTIKKIGDDEDTIAMKKALKTGDKSIWSRDTIYIKALESIEYFKTDSLRTSPFNIDSMKYIPFSGGKIFRLGASEVSTASGLKVKVFEAFANTRDYLKGLDEDLINVEAEKREGLQVGSLSESNNNTGNWEK